MERCPGAVIREAGCNIYPLLCEQICVCKVQPLEEFTISPALTRDADGYFWCANLRHGGAVVHWGKDRRCNPELQAPNLEVGGAA